MHICEMSALGWTREGSRREFDILYYFPQVGSGPVLEVLQDEVNPWLDWSKLLYSSPIAKISLISMAPSGGRIRY